MNAARGGIVDEQALYTALKEGRVAGAGLDVFATEPCTDSPLFEFENVVATPHLGASTDEAQEKAGIAVAKSVRLALSGELVPDAVNVQGGVIAEDVRPGIALTEKLGRIFTALAGGVAQQLDVEVRGEITQYDVKVLELAALKGVFADVVEDNVSYVNAPLLAAERGLEVRLVTDHDSPEHRNLITLRGTLADGAQVSVSGTLVGVRQSERLVEIDGFDLEVELSAHLAFLTYEDRPGIVGADRPHPRRRRREHRRHAGQPRPQGRQGAGRAVGRLGDRAGRAGRHRRPPSRPTPPVPWTWRPESVQRLIYWRRSAARRRMAADKGPSSIARARSMFQCRVASSTAASGGDHHLDGGEALVHQPFLPQRVDAALVHRRPHRRRREVVQYDEAAGLDHVRDDVAGRQLGLARVDEQQRERAAFDQRGPVGRDDLDPLVGGEQLRHRLGQLRIALRGDDPGALAGAAAQPGRADAAAGPELTEQAGLRRRERGEQAAGLVPGGADESAPAGQAEGR